MDKVVYFYNFKLSFQVQGNNVGKVHTVVKRKYRQYMNRKGGFNRKFLEIHIYFKIVWYFKACYFRHYIGPLDYVHWIKTATAMALKNGNLHSKLQYGPQQSYSQIRLLQLVNCNPNLILAVLVNFSGNP